MDLKVTLGKAPVSVRTPLATFIFDGEDLARTSLFKHLSAPEADYLKRAKQNLKPKEKEVKVAIMPDTAREVLLVGAGDRKQFSEAKAGVLMRILMNAARRERIKELALILEATSAAFKTADFFETLTANAVMANFEFIKYKTPPRDGFFFVERLDFISALTSAAMQAGVRRGVIVGEEVNNCRSLANTPGGDMTPTVLANHARESLKGTGTKVTVFDEEKMKALGMGGVLGVAKGSDEPPQFIVMEYLRGPKSKKPIVLVGKGVTFDTGGLNLKPSAGIYEMHMDMSGGAAVIHAIKAAARLGLKRNIVGLIPAVENMPSGSSYRPGDVLRTMSGKTIEVLDTDAEGRVILADALEYAKRYKPALVTDIATLTGAAVVAVGLRYSGLFTTDKKLEEVFRNLGESTGDKVWPLPLNTEYEEDIRGTFGDWANVGKPRSLGGATHGAVFLWQFVKDAATGKVSYPWVHIDIAPRMTSIESDYLAKGALGTPVRLLVRLLEEYRG
jgi:leucyl aminopeptidase